MLNKSSRKILLPKGIVKTVASRMVGKPRDKAGLTLCINTMRGLVSKEKMSIPENMRLDCIIYGSSLAFVYALEDEISVFNKLCQPRYKRLYAMLGEVMSLNKVNNCCLPFCMSDNDLVNLKDNTTVNNYNENRASVPGPTFDARVGWPSGLPGVESSMPLKPLKEKAKIKGVDREVDEDKPVFHPVAISFSNYIPLVPYQSHNNASVAMHNRALVRTPAANAGAWNDVKNHIRKIVIEKVTRPDCHNVQADFDEWNNRFPPARRSNQANAFNSLADDPIAEKDFKRNAFVKMELTMKGGLEAEDFDPRAIQGGTDRLNAALGPFINKCSKQLGKLWGPQDRICYTSGMTAEELGTWRSQFGDEPVTIIECDESRYDAHQGPECYEIQKEYYDALGMQEYYQAGKAFESMKKAHGYTRGGIKYSVPYTMISGSATTSVGNTLENGGKTDWILQSLGMTDHKMLVLGDDNLTVQRGHMPERAQRELKERIIKMNLDLGFECKVKISTRWEDVEFCSSLFWPVEGGFVLGPKIGKRLPKIGFSLRKLSRGEVKGMLLGLKREAGYIPVLRKYAKKNLAFYKRDVVVHFADKRSIYKSLCLENHIASEATYQFFMDRYDISVEDAEENFTSALASSMETSCVDFPMLEVFTARDL
jgi:hypothetical protein